MKNIYTVLILFTLFTAALIAQVAAPATPQIIGVKYEGLDGIDRSTNALYTIDYAHHEIHAGSHFYYFDHSELDTAASVTYLIQTPDSEKYSHMLFSVDGLGITEFAMYIDSDRVGAATGHASKTSSHTRNDDELMLKQNTKYIFKATSGTADNLVNIKFIWYEHANKN